MYYYLFKCLIVYFVFVFCTLYDDVSAMKTVSLIKTRFYKMINTYLARVRAAHER